MPQNLIWLVKWSDRYWPAVIHPQGQPPSRASAVEPYSPASPMEIGCRAAMRFRACRSCQRRHGLSAFQSLTAVPPEKPAPKKAASTVKTRTPSVPHT